MMAPKQLGPYLIGEPLGRGGMGTVYTATHQQTGEVVAIKVLSHLGTTEPNLRQRFSQEIETLKKLHHPNIVQLHGHGEQDGTLFFVMERVEGENLYQRLKSKGPCSWREAIHFTLDICKALKHAHDNGVIHRDLKPANLLISDEQVVKLTDFGIARLFGAQHLTADHSVIGTAEYMAPEQGEGHKPNVRSDLYSLGTVIYTMLAGKPPFASKVIAQVVHKLRYEDPQPLIYACRDIPVEFDRIVMQLLEKDPAARIPTAVALSHQLQALLHAMDREQAEKVAPTDEAESDTDERGSSPGSSSIGGKPTREGPYTGLEGENETKEAQDDDAPTMLADAKVEIPVIPQATHYTVVKSGQRAQRKSTSRIHKVFQILPLLVAGVLLAWATWYMLQPPSPADLVERIEAAASHESRASVQRAREDIAVFLSSYPDHEQARRLRQLDLQLLEMQRTDGPGSQSTEQQRLLIRERLEQAGELIESDPEQAGEILKAIITLYGEEPMLQDLIEETERMQEQLEMRD
jgi:serine/threonine-protein kinase